MLEKIKTGYERAAAATYRVKIFYPKPTDQNPSEPFSEIISS